MPKTTIKKLPVFLTRKGVADANPEIPMSRVFRKFKSGEIEPDAFLDTGAPLVLSNRRQELQRVLCGLEIV